MAAIIGWSHSQFGKLEEDERVIYEQAKIPVVPSTLEAVAIAKALLTPPGFSEDEEKSQSDERNKEVLEKIKTIDNSGVIDSFARVKICGTNL